MFMKTHFSYNPMNDRLIPSKEAGLAFQDGDILMILNHDDPNWWQVRNGQRPGKICFLSNLC